MFDRIESKQQRQQREQLKNQDIQDNNKMNASRSRSRSRSPFRWRRSSQDLIGSIRDLKAQHEIRQDTEPSLRADETAGPSTSSHQSQSSSSSSSSSSRRRHGELQEYPAIEVVWEKESNKNPPRPHDSSTTNLHATLTPKQSQDELPELCTVSSSVSSSEKLKAEARKHFKQKYMAPPSNSGNVLRPRRCFPFNLPQQQHATRGPNQENNSDNNNNNICDSPVQPVQRSGRGRTVTRVPFRAPEQQATLKPFAFSSSQPRGCSKTGESRFRILSPSSPQPDSCFGDAYELKQLTPRTTTLGMTHADGNLKLSLVNTTVGSSTPKETQTSLTATSSRSPASAPPRSRSLVSRMSTRALRSAISPFGRNRAMSTCASAKDKDGEEKKEGPPSELLIPTISSRNPHRMAHLRSRSLLSDDISAISCPTVEELPRSDEVERLLMKMEGKLEAETRTGKHINRLMVYQTLLQVSSALTDKEEREAMQEELRSLVEKTKSQRASKSNSERMQRTLSKGQNSSKRVVRVSLPTEDDMISANPDWTFDDDNEEEEYDDEYSDDEETVNFLQIFFDFWNPDGNPSKVPEKDEVSCYEDGKSLAVVRHGQATFVAIDLENEANKKPSSNPKPGVNDPSTMGNETKGFNEDGHRQLSCVSIGCGSDAAEQNPRSTTGWKLDESASSSGWGEGFVFGSDAAEQKPCSTTEQKLDEPGKSSGWNGGCGVVSGCRLRTRIVTPRPNLKDSDQSLRPVEKPLSTQQSFERLSRGSPWDPSGDGNNKQDWPGLGKSQISSCARISPTSQQPEQPSKALAPSPETFCDNHQEAGRGRKGQSTTKKTVGTIPALLPPPESRKQPRQKHGRERRGRRSATESPPRICERGEPRIAGGTTLSSYRESLGGTTASRALFSHTDNDSRGVSTADFSRWRSTLSRGDLETRSSVSYNMSCSDTNSQSLAATRFTMRSFGVLRKDDCTDKDISRPIPARRSLASQQDLQSGLSAETLSLSSIESEQYRGYGDRYAVQPPLDFADWSCVPSPSRPEEARQTPQHRRSKSLDSRSSSSSYSSSCRELQKYHV